MAALAMNFMSLVLNPKMTNAYFYQKHLYSPVWVREVLAEV
jgi:hypothetical protein